MTTTVIITLICKKSYSCLILEKKKKKEIQCPSLQAQNCTPLLCNPHTGEYDLVWKVVN